MAKGSQLVNLQEGQLVNYRYRVLEKLGAGGMASVWKVVDENTQEILAIKVSEIGPEEIVRKKTISRFLGEVKSYAALLLETKNVVKIYDSFEENNCLFIVMECLENGTLKSRFDNFCDMTLDEVKYTFARLCDALKETSELKIVHRDIKLDNILVSKEGEIKLADFGIAILSENDLEAKTVIGTPKYMAPEVCNGESVATMKSDIYSLGIMLYECAVGIAPFVIISSNPKINANFLRIMHTEFKPTFPKQINMSIPQGLENLIMQMLEKDPEYRPNSFEEVKQSLLAIRDFDEQLVKPYVYKSKTTNYSDVKEFKGKIIGRSKEKLHTRFKSKFFYTYFFIFLLSIIGIIIGMAVAIF